jgi:hypothetical protein
MRIIAGPLPKDSAPPTAMTNKAPIATPVTAPTPAVPPMMSAHAVRLPTATSKYRAQNCADDNPDDTSSECNPETQPGNTAEATYSRTKRVPSENPTSGTTDGTNYSAQLARTRTFSSWIGHSPDHYMKPLVVHYDPRERDQRHWQHPETECSSGALAGTELSAHLFSLG